MNSIERFSKQEVEDIVAMVRLELYNRGMPYPPEDRMVYGRQPAIGSSGQKKRRLKYGPGPDRRLQRILERSF